MIERAELPVQMNNTLNTLLATVLSMFASSSIIWRQAVKS